MKTIYFLLIGFFLFSCKKEVVTPIETNDPEETVVPDEFRLIGYHDENYDYFEIQDSTALVYSEEFPEHNKKSGEDSIDIDLDGITDFKISSSARLTAASGFGVYNYSVTPQTGYEVAYVREGQTIHIGSFYTNFIKRFNNGDKQLILKDKWITTKIYFWFLQWFVPYYSIGPWLDKPSGIYYFAVRKLVENEYKYGWIEVEYVNDEVIYFKRFAIEK